MFVGSGARKTAVGLISKDGLRQYRAPALKESGKFVSNFERRSKGVGKWKVANGHLKVGRFW